MYTHYIIDVGNPPKYLIDYINGQKVSTSTISTELANHKKDNRTEYLMEFLSDQTVQYTAEEKNT